MDRSRPDTTGRSVQTGSGWNWQTGHTLPGEALGNTPTDRGAGADSTRTPQADKAPGFPLCPKGHDITGGSVNGRGEGNRRREKGGKGPSIEGTRPARRGPRYYLALIEMRGGEGALFSPMGTKKIFAFRYALHEKMKESTKAYTEICYYCSMEINKSGAC